MSVRQNKSHKQTETERSKYYETEKKTFCSGLFPGCRVGSPSDRMRGAGTGRNGAEGNRRPHPERQSEIQIEYNRDGKVTALTGRNDDGKGIVEAYPDYIGKDCEEVLKDLIVEINEAGYFVDDIDGNKKNIVLQLEPGSVLPSDDFLADMSASTQEAVKGLELSSGIVTIDDDDYDPAYAKDGKPSPYITLEKAQEIALAQANVNAADAVFDDKEFDHDDGTPIFELEFMANGNEYEYDIHAVTGKVVKAEHKTAGTQGGTRPPAAVPPITTIPITARIMTA